MRRSSCPRPKEEVYEPGALAKRIREGCEGSLRRLRTDRIVVYYQHYPDTGAPEDEALEALEELVRAGKVLHVASSNVSAGQVTRSEEISALRSLPRFTGTQIEWNLLNRDVEAEVVPAARRHCLGVVPYVPLGSGLLTGKYRKGEAFPEGSCFDTLVHATARPAAPGSQCSSASHSLPSLRGEGLIRALSPVRDLLANDYCGVNGTD